MIKANNQDNFLENLTTMYNENPLHFEIGKIAIVGGGRWAKVMIKVLLRLKFNIKEIHIVSIKNYSETVRWANEIITNSEITNLKIFVTQELDLILKNKEIKFVYVANLPQYHFETTLKLIENEKHILVEKPCFPSVEKAIKLICLAKKTNSILMVNHEFLLANYFYNFSKIVKEKTPKIKLVKIIWNDVFDKLKWGFVKKPDFTINVANDIMPHIISILTIVFGVDEIVELNVKIIKGGNIVNIFLKYGKIPIEIELSREAKKRMRCIRVFSILEDELSLNFTNEPGEILWNDVKYLNFKNSWNSNLKPLEASIYLFFIGDILRKQMDIPLLIENNLHVIKITDKIVNMIRVQQLELINSYLYKTYPLDKVPLNIIIALRSFLLQGFIHQSLILNPKNEVKINELSVIIFHIIHVLSTNPFVTQKEIAKKYNLTKDVLLKLNNVLKETNSIQDLITKKSLSAKYWKNTIFPLIKSGHVDAVLNHKYAYPYRIGIYPGVSCMFFCSFCGRNDKAKYPKESINNGSDFFKNLFENAPKNDPYRFYISGGLEPLTNPNIGKIISSGASNGYKLAIYTNGFMLTKRLLEKQDGLWEADSIRISLYGIDNQSTIEVTKRKKSFDQVIENAKMFLKLRNAKKSNVKLGFNYVILKNKANDILQLLELIAEINREVGEDGQIDFLTLREDYSIDQNEAISNKERIKLANIFAHLDARLKKEDLCNLYIDYGYSLEAIRLGNPNYKMEMVKSNIMRKTGYPQISVVVDLFRDIYLYREAGFIDRQGANRYIIGRVNEKNGFKKLIKTFIEQRIEIKSKLNDTDYFDIFDHVVTKLLYKLESDRLFGIPPEKGPILDLIYQKNKVSFRLQTQTHYSIENNELDA